MILLRWTDAQQIVGRERREQANCEIGISDCGFEARDRPIVSRLDR